MAEAAFEFGAVMAGGRGEPIGEGMAQIMGAQGVELTFGVVDLKGVRPT